MRATLIVSFLLMSFFAAGETKKNYFPIWTYHQRDATVYGVSMGVSDFIFKTENSSTYGIKLSLLGEGILVPMIPYSPMPLSDSEYYELRTSHQKIKGLNISVTGAVCECEISGLSVGGVGQLVNYVDGVSATWMINYAVEHKGVQLAIISNMAYKMRGLQIGLFNESRNTKGLQIGIWNVNEKRKSPFINWNFKARHL